MRLPLAPRPHGWPQPLWTCTPMALTLAAGQGLRQGLTSLSPGQGHLGSGLSLPGQGLRGRGEPSPFTDVTPKTLPPSTAALALGFVLQGMVRSPPHPGGSGCVLPQAWGAWPRGLPSSASQEPLQLLDKWVLPVAGRGQLLIDGGWGSEQQQGNGLRSHGRPGVLRTGHEGISLCPQLRD